MGTGSKASVLLIVPVMIQHSHALGAVYLYAADAAAHQPTSLWSRCEFYARVGAPFRRGARLKAAVAATHARLDVLTSSRKPTSGASLLAFELENEAVFQPAE